MERTGRQRVPRMIAWGLAGLAPAVVSVLVLTLLLEVSPWAYVPVFSDDVTYNHQIRTFARAGFEGGYYTINEVANTVTGFRFGPHGPLYPAIYGTLLAPVYGIVSATWLVPALHHLLLSSALFLFLAVSRASLLQTLAVGVVTATYWPMVVMLQTSMQEPLHYALAALMAAALTAQNHHAGWGRYAVIGLATLLRPIWGLAILLARFRPTSKLAALARVSIAMVSLPVSLWILLSVASPNVSGSPLVPRASEDASSPISALASIIAALWDKLLQSALWVQNWSWHQPLETHVLIVMILVSLFGVIFWKKLGWAVRSAVILLITACLVQAVSYGFSSFRLFRILGPMSFVALLLLLRSYNGIGLAALLVFANLAHLGDMRSFVEAYRLPMFQERTEAQAQLSLMISSSLVFSEGADPWCNTVLVDNPDLGFYVAAIPAGFGISVLVDRDLIFGDAPPKSAFSLFTKPEIISFQAYNVTGDFGISILRNEESKCE